MALFSNLRDRLEKRAMYHRTVAELQNLPLDVAMDLDIYRGDVEQLATRAVYGR